MKDTTQFAARHNGTEPTGFSLTALHAMREWISDCQWRELDAADVGELTDAEVIEGVRRHYDGGITAFMRSING